MKTKIPTMRLFKTWGIDNKTPAKRRDIFRDTHLAKKYGEKEVRTHDLMAGKQKKSSTNPGSNPGPTS